MAGPDFFVGCAAIPATSGQTCNGDNLRDQPKSCASPWQQVLPESADQHLRECTLVPTAKSARTGSSQEATVASKHADFLRMGIRQTIRDLFSRGAICTPATQPKPAFRPAAAVRMSASGDATGEARAVKGHGTANTDGLGMLPNQPAKPDQ